MEVLGLLLFLEHEVSSFLLFEDYYEAHFGTLATLRVA